MFSGLGWCTNSGLVPSKYFNATGATWDVIANLGTDASAWAKAIKDRASQGIRPLCVVESVDAAIIVHGQVTVANAWVEIQLLNEPNEANQCPRTPAQYILELRCLAAIGIRVWGPGVSNLSDGWWKEFVQLGGLKWLAGVVVHFYDSLDPAGWPALVKSIRSQIGNLPLICSEAGPGKGLPPDQLAAWFAKAIAVIRTLGVPIALYRLVDTGDQSGLVMEAAGQWVETTAYPLLLKALASVT